MQKRKYNSNYIKSGITMIEQNKEISVIELDSQYEKSQYVIYTAVHRNY